MHVVSAWIAPLALMLPIAGAGGDAVDPSNRLTVPVAPAPAQPGPGIDRPPGAASFDVLGPPVQRQVRIEQRIILRVSPRVPRANALQDAATARTNRRYVEREMGSCLTAGEIGAVRTAGEDRILLYTRNRGIVTARLEKACNARDFYSGFYVERNDDGRICERRDLLQSRAGAKCRIAAMRQLVAVDE